MRIVIFTEVFNDRDTRLEGRLHC